MSPVRHPLRIRVWAVPHPRGSDCQAARRRVPQRRAPARPPAAQRVELAHARAAGDAHHLRHADDPPRAVGPAGLDDHEIDRVGHLLADRRVRQAEAGHQRQRLQPPQRLGRVARVDRRQRAVVPRRQRRQQVQRLGAADLADDDAIRPHPQRVADEPADRHLAAALDVRRARLEADHVRAAQAQLRRVLDRHDALAGRDEARQRVQRRGLARAGAAADEDRAAGAHRAGQEVGQRRRQRSRRDQVVGREPARAEAADRERRTVERQRRQDHVHARAVRDC